jgi:hypothetical protein
MTQLHPEIADEQNFVDHAYDCLESSRTAAWRMREMHEADLGGTFQARFERNAVDGALVKRLIELDLGDAALVFGRIDRDDPDSEGTEAFHIGRLAVSDEDREPVVIDWRAPVVILLSRAVRYLGLKMSYLARVTSESAMMGSQPPRTNYGATAPWLPRLSVVELEPLATSLPRSRQSRTRSFALRSQVSWSFRVARVPAKQLSPSTGQRICCTPTGSLLRTREFSS